MILSIDSDAFRQTIRFPWLLLGGQITFINFLCTFFDLYFIDFCSNLYYFISSIGSWFDILSLPPVFLKWNLRLLTRSFLFYISILATNFPQASFLCILYYLYSSFIFICSKYLLFFLETSCLIHQLFKNMLFNCQVIGDFSNFLSIILV